MTVLTVAVLAVAAGAILVEGAARAWLAFSRPYYVFPPGQRLRLEIDRETLPQLEAVARFDVNADGERGSEVPSLCKGETLYRVLVAGGSQPEGYLLDQGTCWPGALQRLLSSPSALRTLGATRAHVGSIARSGVGSEALDLVFARVLPRYRRLSAIVILVGASDVLRWLEEGAPRAPASPVPVDELFRSHPEGPWGWMPRSLATVHLAKHLRQQLLHPEDRHERAGRWVGRARAMRAGAKFIRAVMPDPAPMLVHFDKHFRRLVQRACAHADRVVVVRQPWYGKESLTSEETAQMWHGGVGQAWRQEVTTYYSIDVTARLMALLDLHAARIAGELGVEQIDLPSLLEPDLSNYYDFFHMTPSGSARVAAIVGDALLGRRREAPEGPSRCVDLRAS